MAKITKLDLAELAKQELVLTETEQILIVGGAGDSFSAYVSSNKEPANLSLIGIEPPVFSTQVGASLDNSMASPNQVHTSKDLEERVSIFGIDEAPWIPGDTTTAYTGGSGSWGDDPNTPGGSGVYEAPTLGGSLSGVINFSGNSVFIPGVGGYGYQVRGYAHHSGKDLNIGGVIHPYGASVNSDRIQWALGVTVSVEGEGRDHYSFSYPSNGYIISAGAINMGSLSINLEQYKGKKITVILHTGFNYRDGRGSVASADRYMVYKGWVR